MENTLITGDRLSAIVKLLRTIPDEGVIIEAGVYKGGSLKTIAETVPNREVIGFDTFEGMPEQMWNKEEPHQPGDFSDVSITFVKRFLNQNNNVTLVKGLFPFSADAYEHEKIAFAHLDLDFYESTKEALEWIWPRLVDGGIIVFDDYDWPNCPGVRKAIEEFGQIPQPT